MKRKMADHQHQVTRIQKRICMLTLKGALLIAAGFLFIRENAIAKGILLGTLCSIVNFLLLGISVPLTVGRSRYRAGFISLVSILARYTLLAIPLVVGIKCGSFSFVAVIFGIFSVQIALLIDHIIIQTS